MPLTGIKIRQAKAGDKPTKLTDANGLYLLVKPSGSKLWRCNDLVPAHRDSRSLVKLAFGEEYEHDEALYGTANHRVSEGSRGRHAGQGTVQEARVQ
ncbi:Arm DNA-binding domain-containing protein [Burkholderia contaminans]|uniref:Arm DNA-binding domain-containing protein n=1 Tax=Burkholderia contaminans TaxID=488447 RepID=UPI003855DF00